MSNTVVILLSFVGIANALTVGKVTGQANSQVDLAAHKTFGILFSAIKK